MIGNNRILALIPARSGSKGLPNKNIRDLHGRPLLGWPIKAAIESKYVDKVVLSTDSEEYAEIGRKYGAQVPFLRPIQLASDHAPSIDFILHAIDALKEMGEEFDIVVLLEPTSPLTESADVDQTLETLHESQGITAAVGIASMETQHPVFAVTLDSKSKRISPLSGGQFDDLPRRQDLEPIYALDGSIYASTVEGLKTNKSFCHEKTIGIPFERYKSFEIDELVDFLCVEAILKYRAAQSNAEGE